MTVSRVLARISIVLLCVSFAFMVLMFVVPGETLREVTGKTYLSTFFAWMALTVISFLAVVVEAIRDLVNVRRQAKAPAAPARARQGEAPAHQP